MLWNQGLSGNSLIFDIIFLFTAFYSRPGAVFSPVITSLRKFPPKQNVLFFGAKRFAVEPLGISRCVIDYFIRFEKHLDFLLSRFWAV